MPRGVYEHSRVDLTGQRFNDWTVLGLDVGRSTPRRPYWACRCVCGVERSHRSDTLKSGTSQGCGCRRAREVGDRSRKHGLSGTRIYKIWAAMHDRCSNPNSPVYYRYGARGITVDPRWDSFEQFYADMGDRPPGRSLDRRDNDAGYSPENCRWATQAEQNRNTVRNRYLTHQGETMTVAEWGRRTGINPGTLHGRLAEGWSVEHALTIPVGRGASRTAHRIAVSGDTGSL